MGREEYQCERMGEKKSGPKAAQRFSRTGEVYCGARIAGVGDRDLRTAGSEERGQLRAGLDVGRKRLRRRAGNRDRAVSAFGEARETARAGRARERRRDGRQAEQIREAQGRRVRHRLVRRTRSRRPVVPWIICMSVGFAIQFAV